MSACSLPQAPADVRLRPLSLTEQKLRKSGLPISIEQARMMNSAGANPPDDWITAPQSNQAADCQTFRAQLPSGYFQNMIEVPENWDDPLIKNGDYSDPSIAKIKVFYYGSGTSVLSHAPTGTTTAGTANIPVVFFNGGPGSDSHSSFQLLDQDPTVLANPLRAKLNFIYIDQRGTGCSDPYPTALNTAGLERLTHYGTRGIVNDAEAIRRQLLGPDGVWKAFGQSYGGYVVHRYSMIAPEHLAGAYAHGASLMDNQEKWLRLRILSQKRVQDDYFGVHPEDRAALMQIRQLIPKNQCFTDGTARLCGPDVMDALTIDLGFQTSWDDLHGWIRGLLAPADGQGVSHLYQDEFTSFLRYYTFGEYDNSGFMAATIGNFEMSPGLNQETACNQINHELKIQLGSDPLSWPINECRLLGNMHTTYDKLVNGMKKFDPMLLADFSKKIQSHPQLGFHLYSGQKDVFVPIETFSDEVMTMGNQIHYTNFQNSGHDGFYTEAKVWQDLVAP